MSMPSSNWAARTFRGAFQKTVTNVFYSRGVSTRRRRSRRAAQQISIESLENRRLLDASADGYIKIDLSNLDQTGLTTKHDIYMLGFASASGQILQQDPTTKVISLGPPLASDLVVPVTPSKYKGSSATISTSANLFVGGNVKFSDGTTSTIASISANVVTASGSPLSPYYQTGWTPSNNAVVKQPSAVNQGTVSNSGSTSTVTGVPIAAGTASGIRLDSIVNGYFPPSVGTPSANAVVSVSGTVTGFNNLNNANAKYQYPPTVSF